ncbi:MAG: hypothetical protein JSS35_06420, partial [Proteobacteria bacterium]|nr:hypothetical protein [Pseudomonadota bacterium]
VDPTVGPPHKITLAVAGEVRTYTVADPTQPGGERARVGGVLYAARRQPTPDEIKRINDTLSALDKGGEAKAASSPDQPD